MPKRALPATDDETRARFDREGRATLPRIASNFAECAKAFGAEIGPNGWARCSDVPAEALAACLDPMIVALAAYSVPAHRIVNQLHHTIERTRPPACFPFMPYDLLDASSAVRGVIVERIRQVVRDGVAYAARRGHPPISEARKTRALQIRAAGGSNRKAAMELYDTRTPTRQQVSNASTILREFTKKTIRPGLGTE
jgi:hypothetical protein